MQLRPRDGTGRAITANDGKLRSFTKILDQDESDDLTYEGVRGGKIYKMLKTKDTSGNDLPFVKFAEYKPENDVNKKVPKLKNIYSIVKKLVRACTKNTDPELLAGTAVWNFKSITAIREYYVGTGLITDKEFGKILKEFNLLTKAEIDENTTDYNDIKAFVDEAISTYRKMHPNRPIALNQQSYVDYVNKVLQRVRKTYLSKTGQDFKQVTKNGSGNNGEITVNGDAVNSVSVTLKKDLAELIDDTNKSATKIVKITPSVFMSASDVSDPSKFLAMESLFQGTPDAIALKELINEMYLQFVKRTEKLIKKDLTITYEFKDGGRKHRSGGVRKPTSHHSRRHDGAHKSGHKKRAGRSRR